MPRICSGTLQEQTLRGCRLADAELRYVAPELFTGRKADVRSDIFTLGVLIYEMATGAPPYDGATLPELLGTMLSGSAGAIRASCSRRCPRPRRRRSCARSARRRRSASATRRRFRRRIRGRA